MRPDPPPPADDPADRIAAGLYKLALVLRHASWRASGARGLTPTQSQILALLGDKAAAIGVKAVAERLAITIGTASEAVSALEQKGLLTKRASPSDRRAVRLELTRAGRREAKRAREWPEVLVAAAGALPPAEQAGLVRGLVGMVRELQRRGAVPASRMCVECRFFRPNQAPGAEKPHVCLYIGAPIGDADLRVDCREMEPVPAELAPRLWSAFVEGTSLGGEAERAEP